MKSDKNFQFQQNGTNFGGFEDLESGVSEKFQFFTPKYTSVLEFTPIKPLRPNRLGGLTSGRVPEKSKKVTETPIRKACRR